MATTPNYANGVVVGAGVVATGDTSRTTPNNKTTILTAGSSGTRVERVSFAAIGATTASLLRLFLYDGTAYHLLREITVPAITPASGSLPVWQTTHEAWSTPNLMPILLPNGWSIVAAINDTQSGGGVKVIAEGANF